MNKKKASILTIILTIIIFGIFIVLMIVKPYGGKVSLFHAFSPFLVGLWLAERIVKFYDWLIRKN